MNTTDSKFTGVMRQSITAGSAMFTGGSLVATGVTSIFGLGCGWLAHRWMDTVEFHLLFLPLGLFLLAGLSLVLAGVCLLVSILGGGVTALSFSRFTR